MGQNEFHIYASSAALFVQAETGRKGDALVRLEIARSAGRQKYDWDHKIAIQMTLNELIVFAAVLHGWVRQAKWDNRGADHVKSFGIEHQGGNLYLMIREAMDSAAMPITPPDTFRLAALCLSQISKNFPDLPAEMIPITLRNTVGRMFGSN